jgi:HlyD family type I secretion membrane fusion protein
VSWAPETLRLDGIWIALWTRASQLPWTELLLGSVLMALLLLTVGGRPARTDRRSAPGQAPISLQAVTRRERLLGWAIVLLFFGGGGLWAWLAPLASAAVAPGVVSPEGKRKTVQHLEGGIIRVIHVREGSRVRAGDALVTLEGVRAHAEYDVLRDQYLALRATVARLEAEQADAPRLTFPEDLLGSRSGSRRKAVLATAAGGQDPDPDEQPSLIILEDLAAPGPGPEVEGILAVQRQLFAARRAVREGRRRITWQRVVQLEAENDSLAQQIASESAQLSLIEDEIKGVKVLVGKGLERKPRLLALQRAQADIQGQQAAFQGRIAANREAIGQAQLENITAEQQDRQEISRELDEARRRLDKVRNRLPATEDALARTVVRAPVEGEVVDLRATTVGGVLKPGEPILDVMPSQADLLIEARLQPNAIKDVRRGLPARVVLTAYPQRNLPIIHGVVREVSADRLVDERTGQPYFAAQVAVEKGELGTFDGGDVALLSGMPAEVMILTGERTFLDYLLRPFYDAIRNAFRER